MSRNNIEFPHPVLNEYLNDYTTGFFSLELINSNDNSDNIELELSYNLDSCSGLKKYIEENKAEVVVKITCNSTSYRQLFKFENNHIINIVINKSIIKNKLALRGYIISKCDDSNFILNEQNQKIFKQREFKIKKGDILADEPGIDIQLDDTELEKAVSSIFQIDKSSDLESLKIIFPSNSDEDYENYYGIIHIMLPEEEYNNYHDLRLKYSKFGIRRFLQGIFIFPALTEAIELLRQEEEHVDDEQNTNYNGSIWADTIRASLEKLNKDLSDRELSAMELANILLSGISKDACKDLLNKMKEWIEGSEDMRVGGID